MKRSPLLVIFVTVFIDLVGFGIVIPILPYYVLEFGASPAALGMLLASYSVAQLIFSPILGRLSDKHGRRPLLLLSIVGTGIGFLVMGWATALWMLFAGRILAGITGGNISIAQAYVADVTTPENRARGMGLFGAAFGLGFIFGPAIGGIMSKFGGVHVPVIFAGALSFANAALLYFALPETVTPDHPARATVRGWSHFFAQLRQRQLAVVLLIYFLFVVSFSIMTTTFTPYTIYRFDYDALDNGYLFAYIGTLSAFIQGVLVGRLVRRFGETALVVTGALVLSVSLLVLPFIGPAPSGGLPALLALLTAFSVGNSLATPSISSLASKSAGAAEQGGVLGATQSAASLARAVGPFLGGWLIYSQSPAARHGMDDRSLTVTFWTASAIMFAALLLSLYFSRLTSYAGAGEVVGPASG